MLPTIPSLIKISILAIILGFVLLASNTIQGNKDGTPNQPADVKLLVFTKTEGFRHASIPDGVAALKLLASEKGWHIDHRERASIFTSDSLETYQAIIFLNTTGDILNEAQQKAFEGFIGNGGGFAGIHAASDTEYEWPWYGELVGAYFESHPQIQEARIEVTNPNHPSTDMLPAEWIRTDEWYNFRDISSEIKVLMQLDESSYQGGNNGEYHPIAWYQEYSGGRMFYTACGHTSESYSEDLFLKHLAGGINYVISKP